MQVMRRTDLQRFHMLWQEGIIGGADSQLAILVAPEGKEVPAVCDCQRVRVAASYLDNVAAAQGGDGLRNEDVIAVSMPKPPKVAPTNVAEGLV